MQIFAKTIGGKTITVSLSPKDTIDSLKQKIEDKDGVPAGLQRLVHDGKSLDGDRTMVECGIREWATVSVLLRLLSGPAKVSGDELVQEYGSLSPAAVRGLYLDDLAGADREHPMYELTQLQPGELRARLRSRDQNYAHVAAEIGAERCLRYVVASEGRKLLSAPDSNGWTAAHIAAAMGHVNILRTISDMSVTAWESISLARGS